jgi:hypothetical protein
MFSVHHEPRAFGAMAKGVQVGGELPSANARKADMAPDSLELAFLFWD